jgi:hypothetical protein
VNSGNSGAPRNVCCSIGTAWQPAALRPAPERFEMFWAKSSPLLLGSLVLGACAVTLPTGPTVLAVPPAGKDLAAFQRDDTTCRGYAQQQIASDLPQQAATQSAAGSAATGTTAGASHAPTTDAGLQQRYDVAYAQCMASNGDQPQSMAVAWPYGYGPYGYPYPYPAYYDYWFGPVLGFGFFGGGEARFHHGFHHGFGHHGFHRG